MVERLVSPRYEAERRKKFRFAVRFVGNRIWDILKLIGLVILATNFLFDLIHDPEGWAAHIVEFWEDLWSVL